MSKNIGLSSAWGVSSNDIGKFSNGLDNVNYPYNENPWFYPNFYTPIVKEYYPFYLSNWNEKNKTEQAFKIVQKLIEKDRIKISIVKDFIEIVNEIVETL